MAAAPQSRVVLCGSMRVHEDIARVARALESLGVPNVAPTPDAAVATARSADAVDSLKRAASMRHFRHVMSPQTWGVLLVNRDAAGARAYVGASAFAEAALAFAHGKAIYLLEDFPERYGEELRAWQAICLGGDLRRLAQDFCA